jgi:hypothetical protein
MDDTERNARLQEIFNSPEAREMFKEMHDIQEKGLIDQLRGEKVKDDWVYRDIPWCYDETMKAILEKIGDENYVAVAMSRMPDGDDPDAMIARGQFLIGPVGIENLKAHIDLTDE